MTESDGVLGADTANYLTTMRRAFGDDPSGLGLQRPPFVALPLKLAVAVLPVVTATKALAMLSWLISGFAVYALAKRISPYAPGLTALMAGSGYLLSTMFAGMLVWGWLSFVSLALVAVVALLLTSEPAARGWWRHAFALGITLDLVASTQQITAAFVGLWLVIYGVGLLALRDRAAIRMLIGAGLTALAAGWALIPLYLGLRGATDGSYQSVGFRGWDQLWAGFSFFFREPHVGVWIALSALAVVGLAETARALPGGRRVALMMGSMLAAALLIFAVNEALAFRMLYFVTIPVWTLGAVALSAIAARGSRRITRWPAGARSFATLARPAGIAAAALLAIVLFGRFDARLTDSMRFYGFLDARHVDVAEYIERTTDSKARFIAYPFALGWWVEGAAGRDAYEIGRFGDALQSEHSALAEAVLAGNHAIWNGAVLVGDSFPEATGGTPQIWIALPLGERVPIVALDDARTALRVVEQSGFVRVLTLADLDRVISADEPPGRIRLNKRFTLNSLTVEQETALEAGRYRWDVTYRLSAGSAGLLSMELPLSFAGGAVELLNPGTLGTTLTVQDHLGFQYAVDVQMRVETVDANATLRLGVGPDASSATIVAVPAAPSSTLSLRFEVTGMRSVSDARPAVYDLETLGSQTLQYIRADDVIREAGIDHVVVDLRPTPARIAPLPAETIDRLNGSPAFSLLREQDGIAIYRVLPAPWSIDRAAAAPSTLAFVAIDAVTDSEAWSGLRATDLRVEQGVVLGRPRSVIAAQVEAQAGAWAGLILRPPQSVDWADSQQFHFQFRWDSLAGLTSVAVGLVDQQGRRWAWNAAADAVVPLDDGWVLWTLLRDDAQRRDDGFRWDQIAELYITALSGDQALTVNGLQAALIGAMQPSVAAALGPPAPALAPGQPAGAFSVIVDTAGLGVSLRTACTIAARLPGQGPPEGARVRVMRRGTHECAGWSIVEYGGRSTWVQDEYLAPVGARSS